MVKNINEFIIFLKEQGFVYSGSEIYGGLSNTWDYGPLGSIIKNNIKKMWTKHFIYQQPNNFLIDSSIFLNSKVWKASGHIEKFNDPMVDCKSCKNRFRADHLIEEHLNKEIGNMDINKMTKIIQKIKCPHCQKNNWTEVREFKLMFETSNSKIGNDENIYLRPETAQGVYINFNNYKEGIFGKIPFGIGQIGKAFRNEITPGHFIFRTKEFEQMELEFYCKKDDEKISFENCVEITKEFLRKLKLDQNKIKIKDIDKDSLAHYSSKTFDFEYEFPFGWGEILGIANRGDFDLKNHSKFSGNELSYFEDGKRFIPSIIETSIGVERIMFAILWNAWIKISEDSNYLELPYEIAPYKISILPMTKNEVDFSKQIQGQINNSKFIENSLLLTKGSIGKRYKKIDSFGIPFAITIDSNSLLDGKITIRISKSKEQFRISLNEIDGFILKNI